MTRPANSDNFTPFSTWIRNLGKKYPELGSGTLSIQNLDYIVHNYRDNWIMLIEEKRNNARQSFAQADTHNVVHQMMRNSHGDSIRNLKGQEIEVHYRGYHLIQFENTNPDDGGIIIDGHRHSRNDLLELLRTGYLPKGTFDHNGTNQADQQYEDEIERFAEMAERV